MADTSIAAIILQFSLLPLREKVDTRQRGRMRGMPERRPPHPALRATFPLEGEGTNLEGSAFDLGEIRHRQCRRADAV
jgi:hypothetical protein